MTTRLWPRQLPRNSEKAPPPDQNAGVLGKVANCPFSKPKLPSPAALGVFSLIGRSSYDRPSTTSSSARIEVTWQPPNPTSASNLLPLMRRAVPAVRAWAVTQRSALLDVE